MSGQIFVLVLVGIVMFSGIIRSHYRAKERRHGRSDDTEAQKTQERIKSLEERIRVLERIVTDERYELKQRFRELGS